MAMDQESLVDDITPDSPTVEGKHESFSKFGSDYTYVLRTETRKQWAPIKRLADGTVIDTRDKDWPSKLPKGIPPSAVVDDWLETDTVMSASYVVEARFRDKVDTRNAWRGIVLLGTSTGSILGIELERDTDTVMLLDPCIVQFNDVKSTLHLHPIFNVGRKLQLNKSCIYTRQPPAESLIALYPGFVIQNKMFKYQLKPRISLSSSMPLGNTGEDVKLNTKS